MAFKVRGSESSTKLGRLGPKTTATLPHRSSPTGWTDRPESDARYLARISPCAERSAKRNECDLKVQRGNSTSNEELRVESI